MKPDLIFNDQPFFLGKSKGCLNHLKREKKNRVHVLIVENQPICADVMGRQLQRAGCSYDHVYSGEEALKMVELNDYSLIFMDIGYGYLHSLLKTLCLSVALRMIFFRAATATAVVSG